MAQFVYRTNTTLIGQGQQLAEEKSRSQCHRQLRSARTEHKERNCKLWHNVITNVYEIKANTAIVRWRSNDRASTSRAHLSKNRDSLISCHCAIWEVSQR
jgi:hypothetical protein